MTDGRLQEWASSYKTLAVAMMSDQTNTADYSTIRDGKRGIPAKPATPQVHKRVVAPQGISTLSRLGGIEPLNPGQTDALIRQCHETEGPAICHTMHIMPHLSWTSVAFDRMRPGLSSSYMDEDCKTGQLCKTT